MSDSAQKNDVRFQKLNERIHSLEKRLQKLESTVSLPGHQIQEDEKRLEESREYWEQKLTVNEIKLESGIGEYGLAWLGNFVLLTGISFLTQYLQVNKHLFFSITIGYGSILAIFLLAKYIKNEHAHLASMFQINGYVLLFLISLRLHFFSSAPAITNKSIVLLILVVIVAIVTAKSLRSRSKIYFVMSLVFFNVLALVCDSVFITLPLILLSSGMSLILYVRFGWRSTLNVSLILAYIASLIWLLNNPVMGHDMEARPELEYGHFYLFALGGIYSLVALLRVKEKDSERFSIGIVIANGIGFTLLMAHVILTYFREDYINMLILITFTAIGFSILIKQISQWNFPSAFYALYGFMAMSVAIYGVYDLPGSYFLLSLQSLLVISMALWFKNRIIVFMNAVLFISLFFAYLISSQHTDLINYSFALVAMITARILNWKKIFLGITTDNLRIFYLFMGFFMVLYALYHGVPKQYITLSWTIAALLYFFFSIILHNKRYRYMALGTLVAAALYLFIVDLATIDVVYRVLALLVLSVLSIGISVYYSKHIKKSAKKPD